MIISFSIENWMSFRDPVKFSMVASREKQHGDRVPFVKKYPIKVLPIAAIYGGNASGKTNFFKALSFAKRMVIHGRQPDSSIDVEPFRFDAKQMDKPSKFTFELLIDETIYEFLFSVTRNEVVEEKLTKITSGSERVFYHRRNGKPGFDKSLKSDQFLNFAFRGTRDNQLFLSNSVSQKVDRFLPVYEWFRDTLILVAPDSRFQHFDQSLDEGQPLYKSMNDVLPELDTGISRLAWEDTPFDNLSIPDSIKTRLREEVKEDRPVRLISEQSNEHFAITIKDGKLSAKKLVTFHPNSNAEETKFEVRQESDGSQRLIDLLPAFLDLSIRPKSKVYIIDEVDRSLHTLLTRQLIETYLSSCSHKSRNQLLFTTHDVLLMDQQLLRRDEMWVTERDQQGATSMLSFSEYKDVRNDKDIRKSYLQGRLGGIPRLLLSGKGLNSCLPDDGQEQN